MRDEEVRHTSYLGSRVGLFMKVDSLSTVCIFLIFLLFGAKKKSEP